MIIYEGCLIMKMILFSFSCTCAGELLELGGGGAMRWIE
jgi:hypothetical protein